MSYLLIPLLYSNNGPYLIEGNPISCTSYVEASRIASQRGITNYKITAVRNKICLSPAYDNLKEMR